MSSDDKYSFSVTWSDEDNSYLAICPEFPGLSAFGDDPAEALEEARIVLKSFIEVYAEDGMELPAPLRTKDYSGQLRVRMPRALHAQLARLAEHDGVSLNMIIVSYLSASAAVRNPVFEK